jgi:hypothetical protein
MPYGIFCSSFRTDPGYHCGHWTASKQLYGREKVWVRREVEKTVAPERKDARVGDRVTKVRSREVRNTAEAMSKDESDNEKTRGSHKKSCCPFSGSNLKNQERSH